MGPHKSRVEGDNHLPLPAGHPFLMQPRTQLAFWAASAHYRLMSSFSSTGTPKSFSTELLSGRSSPSSYKYLGLPQPKCSTLHLALLNLMAPLLQPVQIPLDGFPSFQRINCPTQLGVIRKLAEGALDAIVYVIDEDIEEHRSQD